jgi:hypothetical protein
MGRRRRKCELLQHWREILRAIRSNANANTDFNGKPYSDTYDNGYTNNDAYYNADPYRHDHTQCKPDSNTDWNTNSYSYSYLNGNRNTEHNAPSYSHTESSPKSKGATYSATAPDARTDSIIATTNRVAAAYLASSHYTSPATVLAASYSGTAALTL